MRLSSYALRNSPVSLRSRAPALPASHKPPASSQVCLQENGRPVQASQQNRKQPLHTRPAACGPEETFADMPAGP